MSPRRGWLRARGDRGMVTAELAVAIPSVVLVLALCLVGVRAGIDQIRCVDAASLASRAAARGDDPAKVAALAREAAPDGARVQVGGSGGQVRVTVTARTGGWGALPGWDLTASAVTPVEAAP
ncbi:TadE family type IV pilus minor pilin [Terrabacter sp. NPDC080008]|uniref:TadE family type IV pilus minor pilin n=1 Tax=Terrabacter sp. NPDC080008 TaxID=3155176 RepID=UPI00344C20ED